MIHVSLWHGYYNYFATLLGYLCCCSVAHSCWTLCDPMDCSTPGFPVLHCSQSLLKLMFIDSVMPSNRLILCRPLLLPSLIFPSIRVFSKSWLLVSHGHSIGASASTSVLPMNIQGWFPIELTGSDLLAVQGTLKSILQHHSSKASILFSAFFMAQLSHPYLTTGKTIALTRWSFVPKVVSLLFSILFRLAIAFLPRSKCILISRL